jgi:Na+/proline symporter
MIYLLAILGYLFLLTGVGIYKARQVRTRADFSVAGRSLSPWILVCTMLAAWIGTGSIVGNAGKTYETGLAALILPWGSVVGLVILTRIAPKARSFDVYSVPEIISLRYGQTARLLAVIGFGCRIAGDNHIGAGSGHRQ